MRIEHDHPVIRGTAQNPDVYFQGREAVNPFYSSLPTVVQDVMNRFAAVTGRSYHLFDYHGHAAAERVIIAMGSGVETIIETVDWLAAQGEKVGVIAVRLFLPFDVKAFLAAMPTTVKAIAVLDRTKEPGSLGEPLYMNVIGALAEGRSPLAGSPRVVGGRYGLGSKEFTPGMVRAVFTHLEGAEPRNHFTVGINDDVTGLSLDYDPEFDNAKYQISIIKHRMAWTHKTLVQSKLPGIPLASRSMSGAWRSPPSRIISLRGWKPASDASVRWISTRDIRASLPHG